MPKGFVTPSNFSFNSSHKIWTEIRALLGYKLPGPNVKGEVQGARLVTGVTHRAMFRAICLEVLLWHPLRDKLFGGSKRSKTEKRFLQLMSQLCQQERSERLRYKIPAQGFTLNILILKQRHLKIRFEEILRSCLGPYTNCSRLKREITTTERDYATK